MRRKNNPSLLIMFTSALAFAGTQVLVACNESDFAGKSDSNSAGSDDATPSPSPVDPVPDCEIDGDGVKINQHAATIMDCIKKGSLYHFGWQKCVDVPKATSFTCTFEGAMDAVSKLNMKTTLIEEAIAQNAKLIQCGEKNDGKTIIIQWWTAVGDECKFDKSSTMTVCFKHYGSGQKPPPPQTEEEEAERVRQCIEE